MKTTALILFLSLSVLAQTPTTGRIAGTVTDQNGSLVLGANVAITSHATGEERSTTTDDAGNFAFPFLSPGIYHLRIQAEGFSVFDAESITVSITETVLLNAVLPVAGVVVETSIEADEPLMKTDSPTLGQVFGQRTISNLPLATRNFTQLLGLTAGAATYLTDNTVVGRNSQNVSVNGARVSQNNFQINGIDANAGISSGLPLANPAAESIAEFKVQTSLYDATFGRAGGGNIQIITKSGANKFSGAVYDYFSDTSLTANSPILKAIGQKRPVLERNIFGFLLGGAIRKDRAFFFVSYQTTRERNGASRQNSLSRNVLIAQGLTDDRSQTTLLSTFGVLNIHPTALMMLNARLPDGSLLIPTPQANGRYSGSAISLFREEQFNANFDYRVNQKNWLSVKFFFSNAPTTLAMNRAINVPGFPVVQKQNNRLVSIQNVHTFSSNIINEARIGYNFVRGDNFPQQPFGDNNFGIERSTASYLPGFPNIRIAVNAGAGTLSFGTGLGQDQQTTAPTTSFADTVSFQSGRHNLRLGAEFRYYEFNVAFNFGNRGLLDFANFNDFLIGDVSTALLFNGITDRALRTTDYNFFLQDDWKFSKKLTLNLGLRYELNLPPYDTRGRISTFDPSLYLARPNSGPPLGGIVQAGNPIAPYDLPDVPNVGKRVLKSNDPNNFAPRIGIAYSPFKSNLIVARAGYGIFYSRPSFQHLISNMYLLPFYFINARNHLDVSNPFPPLPNQFPILNFGTLMFGNSFDRNNRTPYIQQFNGILQFQLSSDTMLETAYVGTRGTNLLRRVAINQARLAGQRERAIINAATGAIITTNEPGNARLRAPFPGISITNRNVAGFNQEQASAQSTYNSLQLSLTRRFSRGLQFLASYTFSKSIDNASGTGGGSNTNGFIDTTDIGDSGFFPGNQLDNRANRGVSDFDRTHRFVLSFVWALPQPAFTRGSKLGRVLFSGWQMGGIVTAMSGLPIDVIDGNAGTFYFGADSGGSRPNWVPGISPTSNIPPGYYFNPYAFARPFVQAGQVIPSSGGWATAAVRGTDFGNVGRNVLRGRRQFNADFSIIKRFRRTESRNIELRSDFFNLFNNVNYANPISNLSAVTQSGGSIDPNTGKILLGRAGDFGKIISTSNNARIIQFAVKFNF